MTLADCLPECSYLNQMIQITKKQTMHTNFYKPEPGSEVVMDFHS